MECVTLYTYLSNCSTMLYGTSKLELKVFILFTYWNRIYFFFSPSCHRYDRNEEERCTISFYYDISTYYFPTAFSLEIPFIFIFCVIFSRISFFLCYSLNFLNFLYYFLFLTTFFVLFFVPNPFYSGHGWRVICYLVRVHNMGLYTDNSASYYHYLQVTG